MSVLVFGSINMDLVVYTPRFLKPGETLSGTSFFTAPGGKGANQAVAASRLGVPTSMIGRVGGDVFGSALLENLQKDRVDTSGILVESGQSSGIAVITVDAAAENTIIIVAGANGDFDQSDIARLTSMLNPESILMLQLEIPLNFVVTAAQEAKKSKALVILDPAPARSLPIELYPLIDVITPNENEVAGLVGFVVNDEATAQSAARILLQRGVKRVIIKLGGKGAFYADAECEEFIPAYKVNAIDTVAAGDAFNGALAAGLSEGLPLRDALQWGMAAGALSTTKRGAQPSLPNRSELESLLNG
jgi:ribokinase